MKNRTKIILAIVIALVVVGGITGLTYAYFVTQVTGNDSAKAVSITTGTLGITYTNGDRISGDKILPGWSESKTFTIKNTGTVDSVYYIKWSDITNTFTNDELVYTLTSDGGLNITETILPSDNDYITNNKITIAPGVTQTFTLTVTFKDMGSNQDYNKNKTFTGKIEVVLEAKALYTDASGASIPDLEAGMIPVTWNGANWVVADKYGKWYDYDTQWWANVINVTSSSRATYLNKPGTVVNMNDVMMMWVWIPRYEYQYTNLSTQYAGGTKEQPAGINIKFIDKSVTTPDTNYYIHDAFWWDNNNDGAKAASEQLSGIWVAKFELTASSPTSNTLQQPKSIPNVASWRNAQVGTFWTSIKNNMNSTTGTSVYGLSTSSDTHMMKNMEWGAVAYLSQSKYGKYGNSNFTGVNKEIYQNKSNAYTTGCSYGSPSNGNTDYGCQYSYEKSTQGTGASTTGNIYGIYDMSGGASEYVMGIEKVNGRNEPAVGYNSSNQSGFAGYYYNNVSATGTTYAALSSIGRKYYDLYEYSTNSGDYATRYHAGDATYETAGWFSDYAGLVYSYRVFALRGASYDWSTDAGVFAFYNDNGSADSNISARAVSVRLS